MYGEKRDKMNEALRTKRYGGVSKDMEAHRSALLEIERNTPELLHRAERQDACSRRSPCNSSSCPCCGNSRPKPQDLPRFSDENPKRLNRRTGRGGRKNYRSAGGQFLASRHDENDPRNVAITLNLSIVETDRCMKSEAGKQRNRLRRFLDKELPDAKLTLFFDLDAKMRHQTGVNYPERDLPENESSVDPTRLIFKFHGHGIIWHPTLSFDELVAILKKMLPGKDRVHAKPLQSTSTGSDGYESGGLAGWGEYASMEKTAVDLPNGDDKKDNVAAIQAVLKAREGWPRSSRRFSYKTVKR